MSLAKAGTIIDGLGRCETSTYFYARRDDFIMKTYKLLAPDGKTYESQTPGLLGGYKMGRIYGRLDCRSALNFLSKGQYAAYRVFFADENAAIAAGYRPCAKCMPERYAVWKAGGECGSADFPWLRAFKP